MKSRSFLAVAALAISVALIPTLSYAGHDKQCSHHGVNYDGHSPLARLEQMASSDSVTDEQRTKIRALADKFRPDMRKYSDQIRQARRDLHTQMKADAPDVDKIRLAAESEGKAMGELMVIRMQTRMAMNSILPAEQREQFWKYHEKSDATQGKQQCKMCNMNNMRGMHGKRGTQGKEEAAGKEGTPEVQDKPADEQTKPVTDPEAAQL